ncbi:Galactose-1-phosphate uridylyltransferase [Novipirellula aureliae]|uniref:Galactose-1-phosphate uridylyltransferase n=1 Tax=Novipirellula aureliae TaxID=2527966 RepID=A0A5C6E357_9BACT|nr:DUF4921 family protein [Novipirellula aureliae]TWU44083.1 Galactose-1-phosphate uridylyltransferase [Novipirellula aureliae]
MIEKLQSNTLEQQISAPIQIVESPDLLAEVGVAESRLDPISGEWTIFATNRGSRPDQFGSAKSVAAREDVECPFCTGNEHTTPPASWAARIDSRDQFHVFGDPSDVDALDWNARVVPNKYPVVARRADELRNHSSTHGMADCRQAGNRPPPASANAKSEAKTKRSASLFQSRQLTGGHEVIIESPNHVQSISELDLSETRLMLYAYQQRLRYWRNQPGVKYISLFKNVGGDAGASLQHSHSQLIAMDQLPNSVSNVCDRMSAHQARTGCCLQCDLVRAELKQKTRIVAQTDSLIAYCPYASRLPMMIRITSKSHLDHFDNLPATSLDELARLLQRVTRWLEAIVPGAAYNVLVHSRPPGFTSNCEAFHWSIEFFPRINRIAGFEWSSDCMINTVLPETAAKKYRRRAAAEDPRLVLER